MTSQKRAISDNNDADKMILELKSYKQSLLRHSLWFILYIFLISVTFVHLKANSKEICEEKLLFVFLENNAESAFLFQIKA